MQTDMRHVTDRRYVLNGAKMWITNGAVSETEMGDAFLVYARAIRVCISHIGAPCDMCARVCVT